MRKDPKVQVRNELLRLPTYLPDPPDKNPMFLEKRVYQGSSGKVYPLPFTDRIAEHKRDLAWQAIWLENEFLRVLVLPELGGRIHALQDKTNGYDLIYRQAVIKPALVGLAGPWISGGIEFNWPQHHRPATFLPVDFVIEEHPDGAKTVWCGDHDPMSRMKGMHGVCLHPGKAYLELKVRAYNRTSFPQTFLWWANVATRVHQAYRSFFPPDVSFVADHAKRAMSAYPLCQGRYYGVDYGERARSGVPERERPRQFVPPHWAANPSARLPRSSAAATLPGYPPNDLSFYANIPTPCSYMCMGSKQDFFGGYDYAAQAGLVHIANHHIAPGKKQWTWGNQEFGYAWDRNLTEPDKKGEYGPYIELMAGVYTDNQPDFSFLQPGETKTWSQYWYPIQKMGPAQAANLDAAVSLAINPKEIQIGASVSARFPGATIRLRCRNARRQWKGDLAPGKPFFTRCKQLEKPWTEKDCSLSVLARDGRELVTYRPESSPNGAVPPPASEPPLPAEIASTDELYFTGLHLEQYRHATRCPTAYWREALRRDPGDARCNNALGLWHLRRGEYSPAEACFRRAIERVTRRNPNPYDGEPFYNLGLCLRYQERDDEAYAAFYKATWNQAWQAVGYHALAELDCRRLAWPTALDHLRYSLRCNSENIRARNLKVMVLRQLGRESEATVFLRETSALDPLDWWARKLAGEEIRCDAQARLDIAHDYARAGFYRDALDWLEIGQRKVNSKSRHGAHAADELPDQSWGTAPLLHYTRGWLYQKLGDKQRALLCFRTATTQSPDYCFPARLEEIAVLEAAMRVRPTEAQPPYLLGNLLYDRRRHLEAIKLWERSARLAPKYSVVWRNLGIGCFNVSGQGHKARAAYDRAVRANASDARLVYERDQLWKRLGDKPEKRLRMLERHLDLVRQRDDLSVELCGLYNQTAQPQKALPILVARKFQPWEGGEGLALGQFVRAHLALGRTRLGLGDAASARDYFERALKPPENLGEANHLLANQSDVRYWLGVAYLQLGQPDMAAAHWQAAATFQGDFQEMSVRAFSELTYYSAMAWRRLGQSARAEKLLRQLLKYARELERKPATIDYFATSLPAMLLFEEDLAGRQTTKALFLQAQACLGLGRKPLAARLLAEVLKRDPNHALAADFVREL